MEETNGAWSRFDDSIPIPAPSEVVFDVLTDPDRVARWVPTGMTAHLAAPDRIRIGYGSSFAEFRQSSVPSELRVTWSALNGRQFEGSAQVRESGGGGSTVDVSVRFLGETASPDDVKRVIAAGADSLRREVEENFTAG